MAKKKKCCNFSLNRWLYLIALLVAVILSILSIAGVSWITATGVMFMLVLFGLVLGFLNWNFKPKHEIEIVVLVLLVLTGAANLMVIDEIIPYIGTFLIGFLGYLMAIVVPMVLVVAFKHLYDIVK